MYNTATFEVGLQQLGEWYRTDKALHHHFCDFYEQHLPRKITRLLEVGVMHGASLRMWRDWYLDAEIHGVDISPPTKVQGCHVHQADATHYETARQLFFDYGTFDIVIDDGSHLWHEQQQTFDLAWEMLLGPDGVFVMEDLHTSAWESYRGYATISTVEFLHIREARGEFEIEWFDRTGTMDESVTAIVRRKQ